jgi:hypothetical protein
MFSMEFIIFISLFAFIPILIISITAGRYDIAFGLIIIVFFITFETIGKENQIDKENYKIYTESRETILKQEIKNYFFYIDNFIHTKQGVFKINNDFGLKQNETIIVKTYKIKKNINEKDKEKVDVLGSFKYELCGFDKYELKIMCYVSEKISQ